MKTIRRSRLASLAGVVALILAFLVVCPCAPTHGSPAAAGNHACCGDGADLTVAATSCCTSHAVRGTQPAAPAVATALDLPASAPSDATPVALVVGSATIQGGFRPPAVPPILRV